MYVSQPTFTEQNDARPTFAVAAFSLVIILVDQIASWMFHYQGRAVFGLACLSTMTMGTMGVYVIAGCIWHPIPKERRFTQGLTTLNLTSSKSSTNSAGDDFTPVSAYQAELRDRIQWTKLLLVTLCIAGGFALLALAAH
jgi:hypothetical protein